MLKLPSSIPRRIGVSTPVTRRLLSTSERINQMRNLRPSQIHIAIKCGSHFPDLCWQVGLFNLL
jgi:hypothetical protein